MPEGAKLGWKHRVTSEELVREMVASDLVTVKQERDAIRKLLHVNRLSKIGWKAQTPLN
jgi:hypothetical protein